MEKEEKYLPIGTVVILKGGKQELMIMSYCVKSLGETYNKNGIVDAKDKIYDYGACVYPEGMLRSSRLIGFNPDQIEKVCFKGYTTEIQMKMTNFLNKINKAKK